MVAFSGTAETYRKMMYLSRRKIKEKKLPQGRIASGELEEKVLDRGKPLL